MKNVIQNIVLSIVIIVHAIISCGASPCSPPSSGDWIITADCELTESATIRGNVYITGSATLTIEAGHDLNIDLGVNRIEVENGSHIIVENGARIHTVLIDRTDGRVGYYLKKVNGPILRSLNEDVTFYPASTIKVLEHVHAMREVQAGNADLNSSFLTVCPDDSNCSNNPNSAATCGANTVSQSLSTALNRMMFNSNNQSTNAVQEFFGSGNATSGRIIMNITASNVLNLSAGTRLRHKFACGNINNNPFNTATLEDLAKLYEEVGEDSDVLAGTAKASFYQLMRNENNDDGFIADINAIIDQENVEVGLSGVALSSFKNQINSARKAGNVPCCFSNAGWIELPFNNGQSSDQFVFSLFFDDFSTNNVDMNEEFAELLRPVIRETLEKW